MSHYTLYEATVLMSQHNLNILGNILEKAEASTAAVAIPTAKIHEDMHPFTYQVHYVTNDINKLVSRLAGEEPAEYVNNLTTFDEMNARVADTRKRLEAAPSKEVTNSNGGNRKPIKLRPDLVVPMDTWQYAHGYAIPNIFFHLVTAYDIARKEGVPIGKLDYIMPYLGQFLGPQDHQ